MNKKIKTKWLKALRSGDYCQTQGFLIDVNGYCCLGVLLDIMGVPQRKNGSFKAEHLSILSDARACEAGLTQDQLSHLMALNDGNVSSVGKKQTFEQIADYIEKNL